MLEVDHFDDLVRFRVDEEERVAECGVRGPAEGAERRHVAPARRLRELIGAGNRKVWE